MSRAKDKGRGAMHTLASPSCRMDSSSLIMSMNVGRSSGSCVMHWRIRLVGLWQRETGWAGAARKSQRLRAKEVPFRARVRNVQPHPVLGHQPHDAVVIEITVRHLEDKEARP